MRTALLLPTGYCSYAVLAAAVRWLLLSALARAKAAFCTALCGNAQVSFLHIFMYIVCRMLVRILGGNYDGIHRAVHVYRQVQHLPACTGQRYPYWKLLQFTFRSGLYEETSLSSLRDVRLKFLPFLSAFTLC